MEEIYSKKLFLLLSSKKPISIVKTNTLFVLLSYKGLLKVLSQLFFVFLFILLLAIVQVRRYSILYTFKARLLNIT